MSLTRWKRLTEWPLTALSVIFLLAYAWEVIGDLEGTAARPPDAVMNGVWAIFVADYLVSLALAWPRKRWFLTHIPDLVIVAVPIPGEHRRTLFLVSHHERIAG